MDGGCGGGCCDCGGGEIISEPYYGGEEIVGDYVGGDIIGEPIIDEGYIMDGGIVDGGCFDGTCGAVESYPAVDSCGCGGGGGYYEPVYGFTGGGGGGGRGGFGLGGLLGVGGLAAGVTALAIDDDDVVSPAAP